MANEKRLIDANTTADGIIAQLEIEWGYDGIREDVQRVFDSTPTVEAVEVVHGEWLDGYGVCDNKKSYISIDCSNCGEYFKLPSIDENIEEWKKRFVYCPFCGAKMDGGD